MVDPYSPIDPVLLPWAQKNGLDVISNNMGVRVRWIWLTPSEGRKQAPHLSVGMRNAKGYYLGDEGHYEVRISVGNWRQSAPATLETLASVLDQQLEYLRSRCAPSD